MNHLIKLLTAVLFILACVTETTAQDYKRVEVDLGLRASFFTGDKGGGGAGFFLEPRYNINNKVTVGLRWGLDALVERTGENGEPVDVAVLPSYILTGDYIINNKKNKRFFVGLGLGFSGENSTAFEVEGTGEVTETADIGSSFGIVPRVGIKLGLFKVALDYSIYTKENTRNFVGLNLGFSFGGGRRK